MNLSDALQIWGDKNRFSSSDYHTYYTSMFNAMKKELDSSLKDYIEAITIDPKEWIDSFPSKLCSESALAKPKSAMLTLLEQRDAVEGLGAEFCAKSKQTLEEAWKKYGKKISHERKETQTTKTLTIQDKKKKEVPHVHSDDESSCSESLKDSEDSIDINAVPGTAFETHPKQPHYDDVTVMKGHIHELEQELESVLTINRDLHKAYNVLGPQNEFLKQNNEELKALVLRLAKKAYNNDEDHMEDYRILLTRW